MMTPFFQHIVFPPTFFLPIVQVLLDEAFEFDVIYTSMLKRAIKTAWVVLDELSQQHVPVIMDWHLNERCYGALVGREKKECVREFGQKQARFCVGVVVVASVVAAVVGGGGYQQQLNVCKEMYVMRNGGFSYYYVFCLPLVSDVSCSQSSRYPAVS